MTNRLDRFELKFVISAAQRARLAPELLPHLRPDVHAGTGGVYPIISLYYDTTDRDCYWEKMRGQRSRRKLRVRVYGSRDGAVTPTSFVEVKHKCDSRVVKRRVELPIASALRLCAGDLEAAPLSPTEARVAEEVHGLVTTRRFRPVCCMRYDREALASVDPGSDLRITFDTGIGYRLHDLTPVPDDRNFSEFLLREGESVMEVKGTGAVPYWLARMLGTTGCRLASYSKYCNALAAGDPAVRPPLRPQPSLNHQSQPPAAPVFS
ncbi:MAG: polyphosphate polymerase domain-containing protein [Chthoniobacter sp.]|nr:polyphosphate polymerase domain-containing protein [Chthoniobacter sp.]